MTTTFVDPTYAAPRTYPASLQASTRSRISPGLSRRLQSLSLLFLTLVIAIHATTFFAGDPDRTDAVRLARQFQAWMAFGFARIAVPGFFLISGYLFFRTIAAPSDAMAKLRRRVGSLLVPYLAWSALTLGAALAASNLPWQSSPIAVSQPGSLDLHQILRTLFLDPVAGQLWFVRDLIVLTALAPLFGWLLRGGGFALPILLLIVWIAVPEHVVIANRHPLQIVSLTGLFCFAFGGWLGFRQPAWLEQETTVSRPLCILLATAWLTVLLLQFQGQWEAGFVRVLDRAGILIGLAFVWVSYPYWGRLTEAPWVAWLAPFGFFIYAAHYPLTRIVVAALLKVTGHSGTAQTTVYLLVIPLMLISCGLVAILLRRFCLPLFALLNGYRT